jgi:hypothetical protein
LSYCPSSAVLFALPDIDTGGPFLLSIAVGSPGDDVVSIVLNDVAIDARELSDRPSGPATYSLPIAGAWLKPGELNELAFHFAGAATTVLQDEQRPMLSFVSLAINPQGEP